MQDSLQQDSLHLWLFRLSAGQEQEASLMPLLSSEEMVRASRFHEGHHRVRFVVRRALRRRILSRYLGVDPLDIQFDTNACGKPEIVGQRIPAGIRFSTSHSGDVGLLALDRGHDLGVDLESHRPWNDDLAGVAGFFSASEQSALLKTPGDLKAKLFFNLWACKEAFVKATGLGLSYPLNQFSVSFPKNASPSILRHDSDPPDSKADWALMCWEESPGFSAALVFHASKKQPERFEEALTWQTCKTIEKTFANGRNSPV